MTRKADTLGVLESTRAVTERARHVRIVADGVEGVAEQMAHIRVPPPPWRVWPHYWDGEEQTAKYVLLLDALNFCFWGEPKWRVEYAAQRLDGYWALAAALRRGIEEGTPLLEAHYLAELRLEQLHHLLRGSGRLHLIEARLAHAREVGRVLRERYGGSFARFVREQGRGGAVRLVRALLRDFPSFDDVAIYCGARVCLYKRAQILVSDLHGAFDGQGLGAFGDLDHLTAFADYKVPQVLRGLGMLEYSEALSARIDALDLLPPGCPEEVEIRAATIWGVELLRQALAARGVHLRAFEIDWLLWTLGQGQDWGHPYHRTLTTAY
jgi:hypothetical protein